MKLPARSSGLYHVIRTGCTAPVVHEAMGKEADIPYGVGEAAHGMMSALARESASAKDIIDRATVELMREAPPFDGKRKPAIPPQQVNEAADLVYRWLDKYGRPEGKAEVGFSLDRNLRPVPYGSGGAAWNALLDLYELTREYDEEFGDEITVLKIDDWKTAWGDTSPDTLQLHGQSVAVIEHLRAEMKWASGATAAPGANGVYRLEVSKNNLRRRYRNTEIYEGRRLVDRLEQWRDELKSWIAAWADIPDSIERAARPGAGCRTCPYVASCPPAQEYAHTMGLPGDARRLGIAWSSAQGLTQQFGRILKEFCAEGATIKIPGGIVTREGYEQKQLIDGAGDELARAWVERGGEPADLPGMLGLGVENLRTLLKRVAAEDRDHWQEVVEGLTETVKGSRLRIIKDEAKG